MVPVPIHPFKVTFESMNNMVGIDGQSVNSIFVDHRYFLSPITFEELTNFAVWNYQSAQILKRYLTYLSHIKDFLLQRLPGFSAYTSVIVYLLVLVLQVRMENTCFEKQPFFPPFL